MYIKYELVVNIPFTTSGSHILDRKAFEIPLIFTIIFKRACYTLMQSFAINYRI